MATLQFPASVAALGNETVLFLPAVADPTAVTLTEVNAVGAIFLSCASRAFDASMTQAKTKKYRACSKQGFDQLGRVDWTIAPITFIDDPQALDTSVDYLHKSIVPDTTGHLLRRRGLNSAPGEFVPFAVAQRYQLFPAKAGERMDNAVNPEEDGQEFEYMQEFAVTGPVIRGALVTGV